MNPFGDHRATIAAKLVAAGVTVATIDPAASPPFVLIGAVTLDHAEGVGGWGGSVAVTIAVPPPGDLEALTALEELLTAVYGTLGFAPARTAQYQGGAGATSLPAYQLTYPAIIPNPNC